MPPMPTKAEMDRATRYVQRQARQSSNGAGQDFEKKHPRAKQGTATGGQFITKGSASMLTGDAAKKLGVKGEGAFSRADIRKYQEKQGLLVDGKIGRQTASSLLGLKERTPGELPDRLRKKLTSSGKAKESALDVVVPGLGEVETFSKPGTADVTAADREQLAPLIKKYGAEVHTFGVCKRDQMKHGLSEEHANRRCAVIKMLAGKGNK